MELPTRSYCIGWWNVGFGKFADLTRLDEKAKYLTSAIERMVADHDLDILFLGEIEETGVETLRPKLKELGFRVEISTSEQMFGLAVAYKLGRLSPASVGLQNVIHLVASKKIKVAQRLDVTLSDGALIRVYALHWPSRLRNPQDTRLRAELASYLRDAIRDAHDDARINAVIVLGDFNDEPSDLSLSTLLATREVQMARRRKYLFYNPFWRFLANPFGSNDIGAIAPRGTYFFARGETHKWHVVDQMLFSSALLGKSSWCLAEEKTTIFHVPGVCDIGPKGSKIVDHLPILATIERNSR